MSKTWFSSDYHFGHSREFIYKPRGFNSVEEMNEAIIARHNEVVGEDDDVYVLGDLMLGDNENGLDCIERLNGRIHIVLGNHDTPAREMIYRYQLKNVVEVAAAIRLKYKKYHFFLTHFPCMTGNLERESLTQTTINLCGHSHCKNKFQDMDKSIIYHVELDAHDCMPVEINQIIEELEYFYHLPIEEKNKLIFSEVSKNENRYDGLEDE